MSSSIRLRGIFGVVVLALFASACGAGGHPQSESGASGSTNHSSSSTEAFPTVLSLAEASDAVLIGRLTAEGRPFVDAGGSEQLAASGMGIRMKSYSFDVREVLAGPPGLSSIKLGWLDTSQATDSESLSTLRVGQELLIFVERVDRSSAPGLPQDLDELWIPLSGDNGVFDVVDTSRVQPRSNTVTSLTGADNALGNGVSGRAGWSLSEVRGLLSGR